MDIIDDCLSLVPVPYLNVAFRIFRTIWSSVEQVQTGRGQVRLLAQCIAQLLRNLDAQYASHRLTREDTIAPLADLYRRVSVQCDQ